MDGWQPENRDWPSRVSEVDGPSWRRGEVTQQISLTGRGILSWLIGN